MSRTYRNVEHAYFIRYPKTRNTIIQEHYAIQAIAEEGFRVSNRVLKRGNLNSAEIPTCWDDMPISALTEVR